MPKKNEAASGEPTDLNLALQAIIRDAKARGLTQNAIADEVPCDRVNLNSTLKQPKRSLGPEKVLRVADIAGATDDLRDDLIIALAQDLAENSGRREERAFKVPLVRALAGLSKRKAAAALLEAVEGYVAAAQARR